MILSMSLKESELKHNYSLKGLTTIKIGGVAKDLFIVNGIESLQKLISSLHDGYYILGAGSNILVKEGILGKTVIKLGDGFDYVSMKDEYMEVGASTFLSKVVRYALIHNLAGFDNLAGIPASIGGLIMMNASSFGRDVSAYVHEVEVMDRLGVVKRLKKDEIVFSYRQSSLSEYIVLRVWFKAGKEYDVKARIAEYVGKRMRTQDFEFPNCGCIFRNPENTAAGFLIDACGLKGMSHNGARISLKHANFIVNLDNATYDDVDYLIRHIKEKVQDKFGIILEEEIKRWD